MDQKPRILLIGAGKFGKNYVRILKELADAQIIDFIGICVKTQASAQKLTESYNIPTFVGYSDTLLSSVSGVCVATPPETHMKIVSDCIVHTNVLSEKPLASSVSDVTTLRELAIAHGHELMTGQLFRFHSVTTLLREKITKVKKGNSLQNIEGVFINPLVTDVGRAVSFEMIHWYDLASFIIGERDVRSITAQTNASKRIQTVKVSYSLPLEAQFNIGWEGEEKQRNLLVRYQDGTSIFADYIKNEVTYETEKECTTESAPQTDALKEEILTFVKVLNGSVINPVPPESIFQSTYIASSVEEKVFKDPVVKNSTRPRVAIIGAGIFGVNLALETAEFSDVTLFEQQADVMLEGAFVNQFRHHMGYHYPRSPETVIDIQESAKVFDERFYEALVTSTPTYYGVAKEGSQVTGEEFLLFCDHHGLPYTIERPPFGYINETLLSLVIKVPEPSYHYERLKEIVLRLLKGKSDHIDIKFNSKVIDCKIQPDGSKLLTWQESNGEKKSAEFDFVVNSTYARMNDFATWLSLPVYPVRIDLAEVLILSLPGPLLSLTIMDGPFATIMPTGNPNEYTLYHAAASILDRYTPENGLVKSNVLIVSQANEILKRSKELFPILKNATVVEARQIHRGVLAHHEHDDARVADIVMHGFGCWSVLSGKILSSVRTGKRIAEMIREVSI